MLVDHPDAGLDRIAGGQKVTGLPLTRMSPSSWLYMPASTFINVLFPAPFSPSKAWISPALQVEIYMVIRQYAGEAFDDAPHLDNVGALIVA